MNSMDNIDAMNTLKKFLRELRDEANDAKKYYECSVKYKADYPTWSNEYAILAQQELGHFDKIKSMAEQFVQKHPDLKIILDFEIEWMQEDLTPLRTKLRI